MEKEKPCSALLMWVTDSAENTLEELLFLREVLGPELEQRRCTGRPPLVWKVLASGEGEVLGHLHAWTHPWSRWWPRALVDLQRRTPRQAVLRWNLIQQSSDPPGHKESRATNESARCCGGAWRGALPPDAQGHAHGCLGPRPWGSTQPQPQHALDSQTQGPAARVSEERPREIERIQ